MSSVNELYAMIHKGLTMTPGPKDEMFRDVWELYTDIINMVGARLMERRMGENLEAADEVWLFIYRFHHVAKISSDMPLRVPATAVRGFRASGRLLEDTKQVEELGEFLRLSSPILNDLAEYATNHLGRFAGPVVTRLSDLAVASTLMTDALARVVPELSSWEGDR